MPNLKLIAMRLKSVKNIQKITQSMKMVSAAKFAKAERDLKNARPLGIAAQQFYKSAEVRGFSLNFEVFSELCIYSFCRLLLTTLSQKSCLWQWLQTEALLELSTVTSTKPLGELIIDWMPEINTDDEMYNMMNVLELSSRRRSLPERVWTTSRSCALETSPEPSSRGSSPSIFSWSAVRSEDCPRLSTTPPRWLTPFWAAATSLTMASSCSTTTRMLPPMRHKKFPSTLRVRTYILSFFYDTINRVPDLITSSEKVSVYDSLDADVVQSYLEYSLASLVYYCMKEGATSEQASRMSAMDNSSKNAGQYLLFSCTYFIGQFNLKKLNTARKVGWKFTLWLFSRWNDWQADHYLQQNQTGCHHRRAHWDHFWCRCSLNKDKIFSREEIHTISDIWVPHILILQATNMVHYVHNTDSYLGIEAQTILSYLVINKCYKN